MRNGTIVIAAVFLVGFSLNSFGSESDYLNACKSFCPAAKSIQELNQCVEKRENEPGFKDTQCYKEHLEHGGH